jgi:hypothetical protein
MLVGLSLFDDRIGVDVKTKMVENHQLPLATKSLKRLDHLLEPLSHMGLASCFTQRTVLISDFVQLIGNE